MQVLCTLQNVIVALKVGTTPVWEGNGTVNVTWHVEEIQMRYVEARGECLSMIVSAVDYHIRMSQKVKQ